MRVINLRMHQVRRLKELEIEKGVLNTEALLLVLKKKQAKTEKGGRMVFKYLDAQDDPKVMASKMYTVSMLNSSEQYKSIDKLILPEFAVAVDQKISGFASALEENHRNVGRYLNDDTISLQDKLPYLKQIGEIIQEVEQVDDNNFRMQFGDLNEYNFILSEDDKVKAVDLDSCYLGQGNPPISYYLKQDKDIYSLKEKYKTDSHGVIIPTDNTDLYCYSMMILSTLAKENIFQYNLNVYYAYLNHLKEVGVDIELIKQYHHLYVPIDNQNPKDLLSTIPVEKEKEMEFKEFKKQYQLKETF